MMKALNRLLNQRRRRKALEEYSKKLMADEAITPQEVATAHLIKFELTDDPEQRLRSQEVLAAHNRPEVLPLVLRFFVDESRSPAGVIESQYMQLATEILRTTVLGPLESDIALLLTSQSFGLPVSGSRIERFVPVRVFSSTEWDRGAGEIARRVQDFADSLGIDLAYGSPPLGGSWFKQWMGRTRDTLSQDEVMARLRKAERALELVTLHKEQANVDRQQAEAAARLIESLAEVPNASCQIGSLLVTKVSDGAGSRIQTRTLTQAEMLLLEGNADLFREPERLLARLKEVRQLEGPETQGPSPELRRAPKPEADP